MTQFPRRPADSTPDSGSRSASGGPRVSSDWGSRLAELLTGVAPLLEAPLSRGALAFAVVLLIGLAAWVSTVNFWYAYDDALITYRFARNLATGVGLVYNPGEWHLGTTAPLYALILGVLGWLSGPDAIPFFGALISSLALTAGGLALARVRHAASRAARGRVRGHVLRDEPDDVRHVRRRDAAADGADPVGPRRVSRRAPERRRGDPRRRGADRPDGLLAAAVVFGYDVVVRRRIMWRAWVVFAAIVAPFVLAHVGVSTGRPCRARSRRSSRSVTAGCGRPISARACAAGSARSC